MTAQATRKTQRKAHARDEIKTCIAMSVGARQCTSVQQIMIDAYLRSDLELNTCRMAHNEVHTTSKPDAVGLRTETI